MFKDGGKIQIVSHDRNAGLLHRWGSALLLCLGIWVPAEVLLGEILILARKTVIVVTLVGRCVLVLAPLVELLEYVLTHVLPELQ